MKNKNIIRVAIVVAAFAFLYGTYHLLVRERMEKYRDDRNELSQLKERYETIHNRFKGFRPSLVVGAYKEQVAPWQSAVAARSDFFSTDHASKVPEIPEIEPVLLKAWYEKQIAVAIKSLDDRMMSEIYMPPVLDFYAVTVDSLYHQDVNSSQAHEWLLRQERGAAMVRRLLDARIPRINQFYMTMDPVPMALFEMTFFVFDIQADLGTLAELLNDFGKGDLVAVREGEHFWSVLGVRIHNPNLSYSPRPLLTIQMVVVEAEYNPNAAVASLASDGERLDALQGMFGRTWGDDDDEDVRRTSLTTWQKFRRKYLPF